MPAHLPVRARVPGTVAARVDQLGERRVVIAESVGSDGRGALGPADGDTIAAAARLARAEGLPLVLLLASSGSDVRAGVEAVAGWGRAAREVVACSGVVPVLAAVLGPAVSGPALLLGLADHVVMTDEAYAFVSGPAMVEQFTGVAMSTQALGGPAVHARSSGVAAVLVDDRDGALAVLTEIVALLPANADELPPRWPTDDPVDRRTPEAGAVLPDSPTGSYDVRAVLRAVADHGELLELRASWAPNLVTALATVGGRPVGFVANQPQSIAGTLDIPGSQKGARFVSFCDAFNLPLVTFVDTPGFYPGKDLEWRGMIRHGAQLAFAYARATVPRVCVTLRKSYGGAYIVMDSKHMGNDLMLAWPGAQIAVMGAKGAVEILHRRESAERRIELEAEYEERLLNPFRAAERGSVDMVIDPADTRREVAAALELLESKRERLVGRSHDNTPL
ncbi:MAG TPA: carboxyl transferase domain-containing protein [Acidimicrobiales bacterium]|nr:carboxyl transferase domain-containing protein [Acidimicrobiales bacterium]